MKAGQRYEYRTDYLIRQVDRENRVMWLRSMANRVQRAVWHGLYETLRFLALLAGTSLFTFVAVPVMELHPDFIRTTTELLAVLAFALWLGAKLYEPGKGKRAKSAGGCGFGERAEKWAK